MKLIEPAIINIKEEIEEKLLGVYEKHIFPNSKIEFDSFLNNLIDEIEKETEGLEEISNDIVSPIEKRIKKTKGRWYKKEISEQLGFYEEIYIVASGLYEQLPLHEKDKFKLIYEVENCEELRDVRMKELENWVEDITIPLTHFRYIGFKKYYQIEKAFLNDAKFIALNLLKEKFPHGQKSMIVSLPHLINDIPIDFTNRAKIKKNNIIEKECEQYYFDKYYIDDDTFLESLVNVELLKTGVIGDAMKTLNANDIEVFYHVMSFRDESFYTTREIVVDIGDLVKKKYGDSDGGKNYMAIKDSLYRMQYLSSGVIDSSLRGFTVKVFDNVDINVSTDNSKKEVARIIVNVDIVNEYIKSKTINMYKDTIDKFQLDSAKILIFRLQRERIRCAAIATREDEPLFFNANINFFRGALYFSNKKRRENIKVIEKSLDEIVENKIALKRYERKGDKFLLEFYPISEQERKDLLTTREMKLELT